MKRVFVHLSLLAMLVMIASPVLGCCGFGHDSAAHDRTIKVAAASSCHGPSATTLDDVQDPNAPCPSCDNCVDQVVDRVDAGTLTLDTASHNIAIVAVSVFAPMTQDWRLPPTTGPPSGHDHTPIDSPAARNDRLLI